VLCGRRRACGALPVTDDLGFGTATRPAMIANIFISQVLWRKLAAVTWSVGVDFYFTGCQ
jgi:hypothetical protein